MLKESYRNITMISKSYWRVAARMGARKLTDRKIMSKRRKSRIVIATLARKSKRFSEVEIKVSKSSWNITKRWLQSLDCARF